MKAFLEYIHHDGPDIRRGRIPLPDVTPEEFVVGIDCAKVFQYPESQLPVNPMLYVWKSCQTEDQAEIQILQDLGKYAKLPPVQKEMQ